jgi:uncharacterized protein YprB with RNaseH-like and TPR domain
MKIKKSELKQIIKEVIEEGSSRQWIVEPTKQSRYLKLTMRGSNSKDLSDAAASMVKFFDAETLAINKSEIIMKVRSDQQGIETAMGRIGWPRRPAR